MYSVSSDILAILKKSPLLFETLVCKTWQTVFGLRVHLVTNLFHMFSISLCSSTSVFHTKEKRASLCTFSKNYFTFPLSSFGRLKSTLNFYIIPLLTLQFELMAVIMLFMFLTNVERISADARAYRIKGVHERYVRLTVSRSCRFGREGGMGGVSQALEGKWKL